MTDSSDEVLDKNNKIKFLGIEGKRVDELDDTIINTIYEHVKKKKEDDNTTEKSKKRKLLLSYLNRILSNIGKDNIKSPFDFKDINRDNVIDETNGLILDDMKKDIFELYTKTQLRWSNKSKTDTYGLTFLKIVCKDLGLTVSSKAKHSQKNGKVTNYVAYSIN